MKVRVKGFEYTLAENGISTNNGRDGEKKLSITVLTSSLDDIRSAFTNARYIEELDVNEHVVGVFEDYIIFDSIFSDNCTTATVNIRTMNYSELIKYQGDQITEIQEAIIEG